MNKIALLYAMSISVLGTRSDVKCFFNTLSHSIERSASDNLPFLTEKLYRKSIEIEDFSGFRGDVCKARDLFQNLLTADIDLTQMGLVASDTCLNIAASSLFEVFSKIFHVLFDAIEANEVFLSEFGEFISIRIGGAEAPQYLIDQMRPVAAYSSITETDVPYWLR